MSIRLALVRIMGHYEFTQRNSDCTPAAVYNKSNMYTCILNFHIIYVCYIYINFSISFIYKTTSLREVLKCTECIPSYTYDEFWYVDTHVHVHIPAEFLNEILSPFADPFWKFNNINTLQNDVVGSHWVSTRKRRTVNIK